MNFIRVLLFILLSSSFSSCHFFKKDSGTKEQPVAKVNDQYLYYSDVLPIIKNATGAKDSANIVRSYVEDWIKRKLMIQKAQLYLPPDLSDVERQVNDYRESLLLYLYEKELIIQKLDTTVAETNMLNYYEEFKENFKLTNDVAQMLYVKIPAGAPKIDSVKIWLQSDEEAEKIKLSNYCYQYAADYSFSDTAWFEVALIYKNIPLNEYEFNAISRYRTTAVFSDSLFSYVVRIKDYRTKGQESPYFYAKDDISRIILSKRKREFVRKTYDNVFLEGLRSNNFEIYE